MIRVNSLRARLTAKITLMLLMWMTALCTGLILYSKLSNENRAREILKETSQVLQHAITSGNKSTLQELREWAVCNQEYLASRHIELQAFDSHGRVVYNLHPSLSSWPDAPDRWFIKRTPPIRGYTLVLGSPQNRLIHRFHKQIALILASSLSMLIVAILGVWVVIKHTLAPIGMLAQQAAHASVDTQQVHLQAPSHDEEIQELVDTLNHLLTRLAETMSSKGRFYAAVSHELRTPLQALLGQLEVTLSRKRTTDEYETALTEAKSQTQRLISLMRSLLLLHQLESAALLPPEEMIGIAELCERVLQQYAARIAQRELSVSTTMADDGEVLSTSSHALMLIRNLIDNAVTYAAPGGDLSVSVQKTEKAIVLQVYNTCPPIPAWDEAEFFEPFIRRQVYGNAEQEGNGLGLTICKSIAKANGWNLTLRYNGNGVMATVVYPLCPKDIPVSDQGNTPLVSSRA